MRFRCAVLLSGCSSTPTVLSGRGRDELLLCGHVKISTISRFSECFKVTKDRSPDVLHAKWVSVISLITLRIKVSHLAEQNDTRRTGWMEGWNMGDLWASPWTCPGGLHLSLWGQHFAGKENENHFMQMKRTRNYEHGMHHDRLSVCLTVVSTH